MRGLGHCYIGDRRRLRRHCATTTTTAIGYDSGLFSIAPPRKKNTEHKHDLALIARALEKYLPDPLQASEYQSFQSQIREEIRS
jgi:hypothetical protein